MKSENNNTNNTNERNTDALLDAIGDINDGLVAEAAVLKPHTSIVYRKIWIAVAVLLAVLSLFGGAFYLGGRNSTTAPNVPSITESETSESAESTASVTEAPAATESGIIPTVTESAPTTAEPKVTQAPTVAPPETTAAVTEPEPTTAAVTEPEPTTAAVTEPEPTTAAVTEPEPTTAAVTEPQETTVVPIEPIDPPVTEPTETTPPALVIPENGEIMEGAPYPDPLGLTAFSNVTELYEYLKNMSEKELDNILSLEQWYLWDTVQTTHVSKDELQHGIFGYFRNSILSSGAVVVPHLNGSPMGLGEGRSIELETAQSYRKTRIVYPSELNIWFHIMKYDSELVAEATEKGAAWLIYELNPEQKNLHNYEKLNAENIANGIMGVENQLVYEKEYVLADRTVKALVYDNSNLSEKALSSGAKPSLQIFFVYDDMLIKATGQPDDIMNVLPGLTFEEVKVKE